MQPELSRLGMPFGFLSKCSASTEKARPELAYYIAQVDVRDRLRRAVERTKVNSEMIKCSIVKYDKIIP